MKILIVGSGGREHALAWKIKADKKVEKIFVAPGNAGTAMIAENIPAIAIEEIFDWVKGLIEASSQSPQSPKPLDLIIIGPDSYLGDGIVDKLAPLGIPVFGPTQAAAEIEWSKAFAKQFMKEEGIPTAEYEAFTDFEKAREYIEKISERAPNVSEGKLEDRSHSRSQNGFPVVIKASGLALGKGVIIAMTKEEAISALSDMMQDKVFGEAGNEVIIEEFLIGQEISVHAFCDGESATLFPSSQDHKRAYENDEGPNTGGMGTIAPVPWVTPKQMHDIEQQVVIPTLKALKRIGREFKGILFPGIMITQNGPKVIEFNARFGDPETQSYMRILESDLLGILCACINGNLKDTEIKWSDKSACCIVCTAGGYPGAYEKGRPIVGLPTEMNFNDKIQVFHAGTAARSGPDFGAGDSLDNEKTILTNGGRVLGITSTGINLAEALSTAYLAVDKVSFDGMQYRKDIGNKSLFSK